MKNYEMMWKQLHKTLYEILNNKDDSDLLYISDLLEIMMNIEFDESI